MPEHRPPTLLETLEAWEAEVVHGLLARLRLSFLLQHFAPRLVWAAFMFVNGFATIALLALLAVVMRTPFLFPSLGPTAFLFFYTPRQAAASPRNTILGHALGIVCGWAALWLTGLDQAPSVMAEGVNAARGVSAALSLAATGALMVLCRAAHPPAAATTMIVSLGFATDWKHLLVIELGVVLMTGQAIVINRLAGLDYPLWAKPAPPEGTSP